MLRKYLGDLRLEQLPLPMHTITVDLIGGRAVVRESGDAVHAITESINLPILSKPIFRDGQALVDGGLIDNVPADVLTRKGCNFVIAVSVTAKMELEFANNRPDTPAPRNVSAIRHGNVAAQLSGTEPQCQFVGGPGRRLGHRTRRHPI